MQPVQPSPCACRNAKGYDVAETFRSKLSHVSPVWLQLREEKGSLVVTGQHDIDKGWVQRLRQPPLEVSSAQQLTACGLWDAALRPSSSQCHSGNMRVANQQQHMVASQLSQPSCSA